MNYVYLHIYIMHYICAYAIMIKQRRYEFEREQGYVYGKV